MRLITDIYQDYDWLPWKFNRLSIDFWKDDKFARRYLDWLANELNIKSMDDWYNISIKVTIYYLIINSFYFLFFLFIYDIFNFMLFLFVNFLFIFYIIKFFLFFIFLLLLFLFAFIFHIFEYLIFNIFIFYYFYYFFLLICKDIANKNGYILIELYDMSLPKLLKSVYPEYPWLPWKFVRLPRNYWSNIENQREFMQYLSKQLNIKELSDWYNIPAMVAIQFSLFSHFFEGISKARWRWFA